MNPHFIFNSLASIQKFILEKNTQKASLYLSEFSSLMRRILENSKESMISLDTELETLRLYLKLEKMRFDNKFETEFNVSSEIDIENQYIPPMLIQPYLENAIWHGILPLKNTGKLLLGLERKNEDTILCMIEDNGVGRKKTDRQKKPKMHKSTGMKNIEERIKLLNSLYKLRLEVKVTDLFDDEKKPAGTRIEIELPVTTD